MNLTEQRVFLVLKDTKLEILSYDEDTQEAKVRNGAGVEISHKLDIPHLKSVGWSLRKEPKDAEQPELRA